MTSRVCSPRYAVASRVSSDGLHVRTAEPHVTPSSRARRRTEPSERPRAAATSAGLLEVDRVAIDSSSCADQMGALRSGNSMPWARSVRNTWATCDGVIESSAAISPYVAPARHSFAIASGLELHALWLAIRPSVYRAESLRVCFPDVLRATQCVEVDSGGLSRMHHAMTGSPAMFVGCSRAARHASSRRLGTVCARWLRRTGGHA